MVTGAGLAVLSDAGLASLVACAVASERGCADAPALVLWAGDAEDGLVREAAARQAELFNLPFAAVTLPGCGRGSAPAESMLLLSAGYEAARRGARELVWPVQPGGSEPGDWPELDHLAACVDRALLVSRLVALDAETHQRPDFRISTPHVDLTDRQMADLAADLGVNPQTCWWWGRETDEAKRESARWTGLMQSYGLVRV
ncbi:MAG: hypothetical protein IT439_07630 [Phycisphaerales bacterium]|nr:hypothetical protein [Phycisphaerales bacterium]